MKKIPILIIAILACITIQAQFIGGRYYTIDGSTCTITITDTGIKLSVIGMGNTYYVACGQDGNTLSFCNYNSGYVTNTSIINSCIEIIYNCEAQINELTQQLYDCTGY